MTDCTRSRTAFATESGTGQICKFGTPQIYKFGTPQICKFGKKANCLRLSPSVSNCLKLSQDPKIRDPYIDKLGTLTLPTNRERGAPPKEMILYGIHRSSD